MTIAMTPGPAIPLAPHLSRLLWKEGRPQPVPEPSPSAIPISPAPTVFGWAGLTTRYSTTPADLGPARVFPQARDNREGVRNRRLAAGPSQPKRHSGTVSCGIMLDPPRLARDPDEPASDETWLTPNRRAALPAAVTLQIYVAGCKGCAQLFSALGAPVFKIGTTEAASPHERLADLGQSRYGSLIRRAGLWVEDDGFDRWHLVDPLLDIALSPASCVVPLPASLGIRLPASLSAAAFDRALTRRLAPVAIDAWPRSETVRRHLLDCGRDPDCALRATPSGPAAAGHGQEVQELYFFRKKSDFSILALIAEDIVLGALAAA